MARGLATPSDLTSTASCLSVRPLRQNTIGRRYLGRLGHHDDTWKLRKASLAAESRDRGHTKQPPDLLHLDAIQICPKSICPALRESPPANRATSLSPPRDDGNGFCLPRWVRHSRRPAGGDLSTMLAVHPKFPGHRDCFFHPQFCKFYTTNTVNPCRQVQLGFVREASVRHGILLR